MPGKKVYSGKNIINSSFWVRFILRVKIPDIEKLCVRTAEIASENKQLCTQENFEFMSNAVTALALYEMFRNKKMSKTCAYYALARPMWDYCEDLAYKYYKKTKSRNAFRRLAGKLSDKISDESLKAFEINIINSDDQKICIECSRCIYAQFFEKYGLKDIAAMFCWAEEIIYGSMKNISFSREGSMCMGDGKCLFCLKNTSASE